VHPAISAVQSLRDLQRIELIVLPKDRMVVSTHVDLLAQISLAASNGE
jgi:hypothetical protein